MKMWKEGNKLIMDGENVTQISTPKGYNAVEISPSFISGSRAVFKPGLIFKKFHIKQNEETHK